MTKTNVYIDGFNLYRAALRNTPYKWLNLAEVCRKLLPTYTIHRIKYFTATVSARPNDPGQTTRQQIYWRALRTLANVTIIQGRFISEIVSRPLATSSFDDPEYVKVRDTEEKGSDVNLATHLLVDGFRSDYNAAFVLTNDSDLLAPIKFVIGQVGLHVGLISPVRKKKTNRTLMTHSSSIRVLREGVLRDSQFPPTLKDAKGTFHKPPSW